MASFRTFLVLTSIIAILLVPAAAGTVLADHSNGDPPEDPGNNASEVPGVGRPPCIPPQDPGHGQPSCIPPDHANPNPNANQTDGSGDNGSGGGNGGNGGGQTVLTTFASALGL